MKASQSGAYTLCPTRTLEGIHVSTTYLGTTTREFRHNYLATPVSALQTILSGLQIVYEDFIFIDLGSGMGRAVLKASEFPFKKIIGVELSSELHRVAKENVSNFRSVNQKCRNIELVCMDAVEYQVPLENTVFYLFAPFSGPVLERVLANIRRSLEDHPREILVAHFHVWKYDLPEVGSFLEKVRSGEAGFMTRDYMRLEQRPFAIYRNRSRTDHRAEEMDRVSGLSLAGDH